MDLHDFLLEKTAVGELCVICEDGYIVFSVFIDSEDLFKYYIPQRLSWAPVIKDYWDELTCTDENDKQYNVHVHYICV